MFSRLLRYGIAGVLAAALFSCPAFPQGNSEGHGKGKGKGHNKHEEGDDQGQSVKFGFGVHEREVITRYYSNRGSNLPPGLAKRGGNLPPGLENNSNGTAHSLRDCRSGFSHAPWNSNGNCRRFRRNTGAA